MNIILCEIENCDYPVTEKKTLELLEHSKNEIQRNLKQHTGNEKESVDMVYKKTIDAKVPETICSVCALQGFIVALFFEKMEEYSKLVVLDIGLSLVSRFAVAQHIEAVISDSEKKMKKTNNSDLKDFSLWLMNRLRRIECKQSQNLNESELEIMRGMRRKGESFRDLAYIFDRSISTVHQNCQDVEVEESGVCY